MLTKCPACSTTFRVTPTQLKARAGKVRCGQCNFVFNALDTLDEDAGNYVAAEQAIPPQAEHGAETEYAATTIDASITSEEADVDVIDIGDAADEAAETQAVEEAATQPETEIVEYAAESDYEDADLTDYLADPLLHEAAAPTRHWLWVTGGVVAIIVLLLQALYYYRVEVAVLQPDLRPMLQAACKPLHCDVPRPRSIETLSIEASDLRPDPKQPGHLTLTATLRSKALYAQEWPLLELTLTDTADSKLAVKDFAAGDYLPKEKSEKGDKNINATLAAGFPANGEIAVTLPLDVGDLPAAGYRLYIFYP